MTIASESGNASGHMVISDAILSQGGSEVHVERHPRNDSQEHDLVGRVAAVDGVLAVPRHRADGRRWQEACI